jgi:hypothetical protein
VSCDILAQVFDDLMCYRGRKARIRERQSIPEVMVEDGPF